MTDRSWRKVLGPWPFDGEPCHVQGGTATYLGGPQTTTRTLQYFVTDSLLIYFVRPFTLSGPRIISHPLCGGQDSFNQRGATRLPVPQQFIAALST